MARPAKQNVAVPPRETPGPSRQLKTCLTAIGRMDMLEIMAKRVAQRGCLLMLACLLTGGHWAALQGVAWTGMLIEYTSESSLREGVRKTFDGENPCSMCVAIAEGVADEAAQRHDGAVPVPENTRWYSLMPNETRAKEPIVVSGSYTLFVAPQIQATRDEPPVPPPRMA